MSARALRIFKVSEREQRDLLFLLQALLISELLRPSKSMWLVSPWLSDVPVIDNRAAQFSTIDPGWSRRNLRLTELLARLVQQGTRLFVATRPDDHNKRFTFRLREQVSLIGGDEGLAIEYREKLHLKGLLGDHFYLSGSMNFTHNGLKVLEEEVRLDLDPGSVAEARLSFRNTYGSRS